MPTYTQLNNYLVYYKKQKYGSHKISLDELEQWYENEVFVVSYKILYDEEYCKPPTTANIPAKAKHALLVK